MHNGFDAKPMLKVAIASLLQSVQGDHCHWLDRASRCHHVWLEESMISEPENQQMTLNPFWHLRPLTCQLVA